MTKKSAAPPAVSANRPPPPAELPASAAALWGNIVDGLPPAHFTVGDLALLDALCRASAQKAACDRIVAAEGVLVEGRAHPALKASMQLAGTMSALAAKLRLTASSRTRPDAATLREAMKVGRRPWQTVSDPAAEFFGEFDAPSRRPS